MLLSFSSNKHLWFPASLLRRRRLYPTPVFLPGKSHGRRSLVGCSRWGCWGSDMIEWLHFHFSLLCIGEGNGNPLQCSYLENPRAGGAGWAAVYGVAQSRTRLKQLSSSSKSPYRSIGDFFFSLNNILLPECTQIGSFPLLTSQVLLCLGNYE